MTRRRGKSCFSRHHHCQHSHSVVSYPQRRSFVPRSSLFLSFKLALSLSSESEYSASLFCLFIPPHPPSATFLSGFTAELLLLLLARSAALHSSLNFPAAIALRPSDRPSVRPTADRSFRQPFGRRYRTALLYRVRPRFFDPLLNARLQKSEYGTR